MPDGLKFLGAFWKLHVSFRVDEGERPRPLMGKETINGLEDPKDCRSSCRHGNQHVRLRGAEVIGVAPLGLQ